MPFLAFVINDLNDKIPPRTQHTQFITNLLHEQLGSNTTIGKSRGDITYGVEEQKQNLKFLKLFVVVRRLVRKNP